MEALHRSLGHWIQSMDFEPKPPPDVEAYIQLVYENLTDARQTENDGRAWAVAQLRALRQYLNYAFADRVLLCNWMDAFPLFFSRPAPAFFAYVFLLEMLGNKVDEGNQTPLVRDAQSCLCLCGYEYIDQMPLDIFRCDKNPVQYRICTAVMNTAILNRFDKLSEHQKFSQAFRQYLAFEENQKLIALLCGADTDFQAFIMDMFFRLIVQNDPTGYGMEYHAVKNKIAQLLLSIPSEADFKRGANWRDLLLSAKCKVRFYDVEGDGSERFYFWNGK